MWRVKRQSHTGKDMCSTNIWKVIIYNYIHIVKYTAILYMHLYVSTEKYVDFTYIHIYHTIYNYI